MASKIGKTEWKLLYVITGAVDFIQFVIIELILVWVFGIGAVINEILDPIVGVLIAGYLQIRGVSLFKHPSRLASLLGMELLEEFTGGVAQAWIIDIWYIHRNVQQEEIGIQAAQEQERQLHPDIRQPLNNSGMRMPKPQNIESFPQPVNMNGIRSPQNDAAASESDNVISMNDIRPPGGGLKMAA